MRKFWRELWYRIRGEWAYYRGGCYYCGQKPCSLDTPEGRAAWERSLL